MSRARSWTRTSVLYTVSKLRKGAYLWYEEEEEETSERENMIFGGNHCSWVNWQVVWWPDEIASIRLSTVLLDLSLLWPSPTANAAALPTVQLILSEQLIKRISASNEWKGINEVGIVMAYGWRNWSAGDCKWIAPRWLRKKVSTSPVQQRQELATPLQAPEISKI